MKSIALKNLLFFTLTIKQLNLKIKKKILKKYKKNLKLKMTNQYLTFFFNRKITNIINSFNFFKQCFYYSAAGIIIIFFFFIKKAFNDIPRNGQFYFQDPASSAMVGIIDLHHDVMF